MYALLAMLILVFLLGLASHLGWSADSRDGADWQPTDHGTRASLVR